MHLGSNVKTTLNITITQDQFDSLFEIVSGSPWNGDMNRLIIHSAILFESDYYKKFNKIYETI